MSFFSPEFIILFVSAAVILWITDKLLGRFISDKAVQKITNWLLIIASFLFVGAVDLKACFIILTTAVAACLLTCRVVRGSRFGKAAKIAGVVLAIGALAIFKYFNFFIDSICGLFNIDDPGALVVYVPIGISYFSFSVVSFISDRYNGKIDDRVSFDELLLYIIFFPKFLAGPIVKASDFFCQVKSRRAMTLMNLQRGIQIFVLGMFKKNVIADHLGVFVNDVFYAPSAYNTFTVWLAVISYTLQLYFDFSGYSDMAIGCAEILGFSFKRNFNMPFAAESIQDFWRRWHISLSTWFRDYLYIPLGGNRKGKLRTGINKSIVFLLTGLWHGANWTFICWGILHGVFMLLETYNIINPKKWKFRPLRYIYTMFVVVFAFMIFRASDMSNAIAVAKVMFIPQAGINQPHSWTFFALALLIASIVVIYLHNKKEQGEKATEITAFYPCLDLTKFRNLIVFWTVVAFIIMLAYTGASPFVYAQF